MEQGTEEWLRERSGHATASRFSDILAKGKTGEAATRRNYRMHLVTERLTGGPVETYRNPAMQWGLDHEEEARNAIEEAAGETIIRAGFIKHAIHPWVGCSPDGLIGVDGGVQIKCPYVSTNHVETIERGGIPPEYVAQVQGELWVTGRQWWTYASYDPRFPERLRLFTTTIKRDEAFIRNLETEVLRFLSEVEAMHKRLLGKV